MRYNQYIPHDVNARFNEQVLNMIEAEGGAGYGLYWCILEYLRAQDNYTGDIRAITGLARHLKIRKEKALRVLNDYGIFVIDNLHFYSPALTEMMQPLEKKRAKMEASKQKETETMDEISPKEELNAQKPVTNEFENFITPPEDAIALQEDTVAMHEEDTRMPENVVTVQESPCNYLNFNESSDKVNPSKTKEIKVIKEEIATATITTTSTLKEQQQFDDDDEVLSWEQYLDALKYDEEWKQNISIRSKLYEEFIFYFDNILQVFKEHLIMLGNEESIHSIESAKRYLRNFLKPGSVTHRKVLRRLKNFRSQVPPGYDF